MGEEEKISEEKKAEENNKADEAKAEKPSEEKVEEKKSEESKDDAGKESKDQPPPPPSPQEIILRVYMHCEGCARKVRRCLKGFQGVEDVQTHCKTHKVVVKGEKADPLKVLERVQRKSHRQVELLSPIPKPSSPAQPKKPEEKESPKPEEKKDEPQVITVVLKVHMHCEACAQEIKKRIQRMKGAENVEPDLKASQVTVKGVFEPPKLVEYVYKRTGKQAIILKVEEEKKDEDKGKEKEEKKAEDGGKEGKEKEETGGGCGGDGGDVAAPATAPVEAEAEQKEPKLEMKKNEFYNLYPQNYQVYYPQRLPPEMYAYPPQIFSDENPNACSIM